VRASRPIGIFDSGVGGLTVFRALRRGLPRESLVYFGDTANLPYGTKSPDTVRGLVRAHLRFLARRGVKCAVVACNTASAVALDGLERALHLPVIGVIDPGVREAVARTRHGRIGVVGTRTMIASGAYQRRLAAAAPGVRVFARACPLFVPLIEEGWARSPVTRRVAMSYLAPLKAARVDTVILGCTHYPLIKSVLQDVMGPRVRLVDASGAVLRAVRAELGGRGLLRARGPRGRVTFCLTDTGGMFPKVARRFLGSPLGRLVKVDVRVRAASVTAGGRA
jgi:glutamate racemase